MVFFQSPMGKSNRYTAGNQDAGVNEGQAPCFHRLSSRTARSHKQRPSISELRPQEHMRFKD